MISQAGQKNIVRRERCRRRHKDTSQAVGELGPSERSGLLQNPESAQTNNRDCLRNVQQVHSGAGTDAEGPGMSVRDELPPPHPAWPLAVNTQITSSVSREIFISGRVESVCIGLLVSLPAGWPRQEVRGLGSL